MKILVNLTKLPVANLPKYHVHLALAAQRLFSHTTDFDNLDLGQSVLGQWCIQHVIHTVREMRIVAG